MTCCCPHSRSASKFFSLFARLYRRRFEKRGFEPSQKQLLQGLDNIGYQGATLMEIGCGVGHLHQSLLERGARSAVGIDLSPAMLKEARNWAIERGLKERTRYIEGDFMELADTLERADVMLLDKVVCCYPDADGLVHASLAKTRRVFALIYPRDRWYVRMGVAVGSLFMWLIRSDFRPYVHDPTQIGNWIAAEGFEKVFEMTTLVWVSQIYVQRGDKAR